MTESCIATSYLTINFTLATFFLVTLKDVNGIIMDLIEGVGNRVDLRHSQTPRDFIGTFDSNTVLGLGFNP